MRIRKRFPLSTLYSDPHIRLSPATQHPPAPPHPALSPPSDPPSDQTHLLKAQDTTWVSQASMKEKEVEEEEEGKKGRSNNNRKDSAINSPDLICTIPSSSSCDHQVGSSGGDKMVPLKKRKANFEIIGSTREVANAKMKSKTNKKCGNDDDDDYKVKEADSEVEAKKKKNKNKKKRGTAIMEGSRCSRVNGRGWRCCQLTLVGYSLCEHHLGKGRLRSMASVRKRATTTVARSSLTESSATLESDTDAELLLSLCEKLENEDDDENKKIKLKVTKKKRMKHGIVKARSMSSLLGQIDNAAFAVINSNKLQH